MSVRPINAIYAVRGFSLYFTCVSKSHKDFLNGNQFTLENLKENEYLGMMLIKGDCSKQSPYYYAKNKEEKIY